MCHTSFIELNRKLLLSLLVWKDLGVAGKEERIRLKRERGFKNKYLPLLTKFLINYYKIEWKKLEVGSLNRSRNQVHCRLALRSPVVSQSCLTLAHKKFRAVTQQVSI